MNVDPLAPLRKLPVKVRKYYYGLAIAALPLVIGAAVAFGADPGVAATWSTSIAGFFAALLAFSNTDTSDTEPVDEVVEQEHYMDDAEGEGFAQPKVRVKFSDGRTFEGVWVNDQPL